MPGPPFGAEARMVAATTTAASSPSEEVEGGRAAPPVFVAVSERTPPNGEEAREEDEDEVVSDSAHLSPDEVESSSSDRGGDDDDGDDDDVPPPPPSAEGDDDAPAVKGTPPPPSSSSSSDGGRPPPPPRLATRPACIRSAVRHALQILFYGATYAPFCASLLLHVAVGDAVETVTTARFFSRRSHNRSPSRIRSRPVDPSHWDVTAKHNRPYWICGVGWFVGLSAYSASTVGWIDDVATLGSYIWPVLGSTIVFHLLTVRYVLLRPELCTLWRGVVGGEDDDGGGDDPNSSRNPNPSTRGGRGGNSHTGSNNLQHHRPLRLGNVRNWLGIIFALVEFAQLIAVPFGGLVPWLPGGSSSATDDGGSSRSVYASSTSSSSTFVETLQSILRTFLVVSNDETVNLIYSTTIVVLFALLVGEFITSRRCTDDRLGPVLYDILPGGLFLTTIASMLRVGKVTTIPSRRVAVLLGMMLYTTPAVFVSVYRGDLNSARVRLSSPSSSSSGVDVVYAPLLLCRERVVKEIFAVVVVYVLSPDEAVGLLVSTIVLGLAMLGVLRGPEQFSCPPLVHLRRTFLSVGIWSSVCGLIVVNDHGPAGRVLLGCGLTCLLCYSLWRICCRRMKYGNGQELGIGGGGIRRHEEEKEESKAERHLTASTVSAAVLSSERDDLIAVPFYTST